MVKKNTSSKPVININIKLCSRGDETRLHNFHTNNLTTHLFPRDLNFFQQAVEDNRVFEAVLADTGAIVGICYISDSNELCNKTCRHEFGGVFVLEKFKGTGLSKALSIIALSHYFIYQPPIGRIISHIHEKNVLPLNLFTKHLYFVKIGSELVPKNIARILKMEVNEKGHLVGNLYHFYSDRFKDYSDWLTEFQKNNMTLTSQKLSIVIQSNLLLFTAFQDAIDALLLLSESIDFKFTHACLRCWIKQKLTLLRIAF